MPARDLQRRSRATFRTSLRVLGKRLLMGATRSGLRQNGAHSPMWNLDTEARAIARVPPQQFDISVGEMVCQAVR